MDWDSVTLSLSVFPDRTNVPSGYPYTSSLTPMIFTCYRANWKIHKSLKWPHKSQTLDFGNDCIFQQLLGKKTVVSVNEWSLSFTESISHMQPMRKYFLELSCLFRRNFSFFEQKLDFSCLAAAQHEQQVRPNAPVQPTTQKITRMRKSYVKYNWKKGTG